MHVLLKIIINLAHTKWDAYMWRTRSPHEKPTVEPLCTTNSRSCEQLTPISDHQSKTKKSTIKSLQVEHLIKEHLSERVVQYCRHDTNGKMQSSSGQMHRDLKMLLLVMLARDRMEYGSRVVQVVWVEKVLVHINCRVDKCITLKTKGVTNAYTTVSITYYIKCSSRNQHRQKEI